jgi:hypothetical protein
VHGTISASGIAAAGVAARWKLAFRGQLDAIAGDIRSAAGQEEWR